MIARLLAVALAATAPALPAGDGIVLQHLPAAVTGVDRVVVCGAHSAKRSILEQNGSGVALFDYDGDGDLDLYVVNGGTLESLAGREPAPRNALYRNDGAWRFVDVTDRAGVGDDGWGAGVAVGDVDGDRDLDLFVANLGPDRLYRNTGDGRFAEIPVPEGGWAQSATFVDADGDGDLDLYVTHNLEIDPAAEPPWPCDYRGLDTACGPVGYPPRADRLYRNDGRGAFVDASRELGILAPEPRFGLGVVAADLDADGAAEIAVANDSGPNFLFQRRDGRYEDVAWLAGFATQAEGRFQAGMGIDAGDVDGDGRLDLVVTNFALDHDTLYLASPTPGGELLYRDVSYPSGLGNASYTTMSWGVRFVDLDLDGDLDLPIGNGHLYPEVDAAGEERFAQHDQVFRNDGPGPGGVPRLVEATDALRRDGPPGVSRGLAVGDLDGDGDPDLAVVELEAPVALYRNDTRVGNWLALELDAPAAQGELATATAEVGDRRLVRQVHRGGSYASASEATLRFGLGDATIGRVEVRWPDGRRKALNGLRAGRHVVLRR